MNKKLLCAAVSAVLCAPMSGQGSEQSDIAELKNMLTQMNTQYEARIAELESRIERAEAKASQAENKADAAKQTAMQTRSVDKSAERRGENAFNPAISLVIQGSGASYSLNPDTWALPGFQLGGESGLKPEGLSLTETELTASANVDDWLYGQATIGLHEAGGTTEIDLEEAYIDTLSLPAGLGLRFGRFFTETGYINTKHSHAWAFADAPLTSQAFLGKQYRDDGLRLSWLALTDTYLEFGLEALRGDRFPGSGDGSKALGSAQNYFLRVGRDVGLSHSFRLGLSHLRADPTGRTSGHAHGHDEHGEETFAFSGSSNLSVADLIWKWAPNGDARHRNFLFQTEYYHRDENGTYDFSNDVGGALLPYDGTQQGFYVQGVYQFMPRWRLGLRYERLWSDNDLRVADNTSGEGDDVLLEESGLISNHDPHRWTLMADYSHSEFSRLRLQYARDNSRAGDGDDQLQLQYIMTLGAHGAHNY